MGDLGLEVGRQVDDVDRPEWTFFRTDTTPNTEAFRDKRNLRFRGDFDAEFASADHWAGLLTFLATFLGWTYQQTKLDYLV